MPVVMRVSQATRPRGSSLSTASSTASEIWSAILSGWPSVTDSEVKMKSAATGGPPAWLELTLETTLPQRIPAGHQGAALALRGRAAPERPRQQRLHDGPGPQRGRDEALVAALVER